MASNSRSRYTSSSLYSANPRPVGQRRPEDDDHDDEDDASHQRQGDAGTLQGQESSQQLQQQGESPRSSRVIQPNESKRQPPINIGSMSLEEASLALEKQHRNKKYELIFKREIYRREMRERDDKKFEEKKAKARRTAEENERRRQEREANFLRDDHIKTNEKFFRRLEAGMNRSQNLFP